MDEKEIIEKVFSKVVAVHLTDYFPRGKLIRTTMMFLKPALYMRDTIHFSLNGTVRNVTSTPNFKKAIWDDKKIAILLPFDKLYLSNPGQLKNIFEYCNDDTFFSGNVKIPEGSVVLIIFEGKRDLLRSKIISKEEFVKLKGIYKISKKVDKEVFLKKEVDGIEYRIYIGRKKIRELVREQIKIMGYEYGKELGEIAKEQGTVLYGEIRDKLRITTRLHSNSKFSTAQSFNLRVENQIRYLKHFPFTIRKLREAGYEFPFKDYSGKYIEYYEYLIEKGWELIDANGKKFVKKSVNLSDKEIDSLNFVTATIRYGSSKYSPLQFRFEEAEKLLEDKDHSLKYRKVVVIKITDLQKSIRENVEPKYIKMCPNLQKCLNKKYKLPSK